MAGLEPTTVILQVCCTTNCATSAWHPAPSVYPFYQDHAKVVSIDEHFPTKAPVKTSM